VKVKVKKRKKKDIFRREKTQRAVMSALVAFDIECLFVKCL